VTLIIFDPVSSYMGGDIDAGKNVQIRNVLDPISGLADKIGCAIFSITHFNKGTSAKAVNKVMDSAAFVNAPRAVFGAFDDIEDIGSEPGDTSEKSKYLFLMIKSNGRKVGGLKYHIESALGGTDSRTGKPVKTSKVVWDGPTTMTANQVSEVESERGGTGAPRLREAMDFLREELRDGPRPASEVQEKAEAEAIAPETLRRARRKLKVESAPIKGGGPGAKWEWRYTPKGRDVDIDDAPESDPLGA
jgi:putative DNA primase/helicase